MPVLVRFGWSEKLATGMPDMDSQHIDLLERFQAVATLERQGARASARAALDELIGRVCHHFDAEEHIMHQHHYPELDAHMRAHEDLLRQINSFTALMDADPAGDPGCDLIEFVGKWLVIHILEDDQRFGAFLRRESQSGHQPG